MNSREYGRMLVNMDFQLLEAALSSAIGYVLHNVRMALYDVVL